MTYEDLFGAEPISPEFEDSGDVAAPLSGNDRKDARIRRKFERDLHRAQARRNRQDNRLERIYAREQKKQVRLTQKARWQQADLDWKRQKAQIKHDRKVHKRDSRQEKILHRWARTYGISDGYSEEESFGLKMAGIVLRKKFVKLLIMTMIFAFAMCLVGYVNGLRQSRATMMLNYEQSVEGLTPNGTRFNISDFVSENVMELVIHNAGLEGVITPSELKDCIIVSPVTGKKPTSEENYYIPTSFSIRYNHPWSIRDISSENMLEIICRTYLEYFQSQYTVNMQVLSGDYSTLNTMEYSEISSYFTMRISSLSKYLKMRVDDSGKFRSSDTGETFNSIKKMVDNLEKYNLSNYNAYIWENGIVRNYTRYRDALSYSNTRRARSRDYNMNEYTIRREVLDYYSSTMATSVLIPTIKDRNFYMARTRTGVDFLASDAKYYLTTAKDLDKQIATDSDALQKLRSVSGVSERKHADEMIRNIKVEILRIEDLAIRTDREYQAERGKNYLTFHIDQISFLGRIPKKFVLLLSVLFWLLSFYISYKECSYVAKRGGAR